MESDWHLSKTVTAGNVLTIFFAILALAGSYYTLDKRIAILEDNRIQREKSIDRVCDRLERIEDLLINYVMENKK